MGSEELISDPDTKGRSVGGVWGSVGAVDGGGVGGVGCSISGVDGSSISGMDGSSHGGDVRGSGVRHGNGLNNVLDNGADGGVSVTLDRAIREVSA